MEEFAVIRAKITDNDISIIMHLFNLGALYLDSCMLNATYSSKIYYSESRSAKKLADLGLVTIVNETSTLTIIRLTEPGKIFYKELKKRRLESKYK